MDQVKIGSFLKELRKEKDLTQETLAEALGVSFQTISKWENGSATPSIRAVLLISRYLDIPIDSIFSIEDEVNELL